MGDEANATGTGERRRGRWGRSRSKGGEQATGAAPETDAGAVAVADRSTPVHPRTTPESSPESTAGSTAETGGAQDPEGHAETSADSAGMAEVRGQLASLVRAAHPRHAAVAAVVIAVLSLIAGRGLPGSLVAGAAMLVVQAILGLNNDVADRDRDAAASVGGKPVADGRLPAGNASFAAMCLTLVAVPLSLENGTMAGLSLLGYLVVGFGSNVLALRRTALSWLPWALGFALLAAYLSYGGLRGGAGVGPPTLLITVLAALLGVGVHFLLALPDLVVDNKTASRHLPLRVALRTGASRLLVLSGGFSVVIVVALVVTGLTVGLRQ